MIKKITQTNEFDNYDKTDIYSIRIKSLLSAYGTKYDFAVFYYQIDKDNKITSILSRLDNDWTLSHLDIFDEAELGDFFHAVGYSTILSDDNFHFDALYDEGIVMSTVKKAEKHIQYAEIDFYPKLMDIFNFEDYDSIDFESWYVDLSHRIRHGCAKAVSLNVGGEIVSSAVFSSIYNNDAILSSVRTSPEFRQMGYGGALVSEMLFDVPGTVYLMREKDKNESFYSNLGFENSGLWRMYK